MYASDYMDEDIGVTIDQVEHLPGTFMEVELARTPEEDIDAKQGVLFDFLAQLGYAKKDSLRESYLELVMQELGITF